MTTLNNSDKVELKKNANQNSLIKIAFLNQISHKKTNAKSLVFY